MSIRHSPNTERLSSGTRTSPTLPDAELARFGKALGHPVRAQIVRVLAAQRRCMYGSLARMLPLAPSTVSQHLRILQTAGVVHGEVSGPRVCYCIDRAALARGKALLAVLGRPSRSTKR